MIGISLGIVGKEEHTAHVAVLSGETKHHISVMSHGIFSLDTLLGTDNLILYFRRKLMEATQKNVDRILVGFCVEGFRVDGTGRENEEVIDKVLRKIEHVKLQTTEPIQSIDLRLLSIFRLLGLDNFEGTGKIVFIPCEFVAPNYTNSQSSRQPTQYEEKVLNRCLELEKDGPLDSANSKFVVSLAKSIGRKLKQFQNFNFLRLAGTVIEDIQDAILNSAYREVYSSEFIKSVGLTHNFSLNRRGEVNPPGANLVHARMADYFDEFKLTKPDIVRFISDSYAFL